MPFPISEITKFERGSLSVLVSLSFSLLKLLTVALSCRHILLGMKRHRKKRSISCRFRGLTSELKLSFFNFRYYIIHYISNRNCLEFSMVLVKSGDWNEIELQIVLTAIDINNLRIIMRDILFITIEYL